MVKYITNSDFIGYVDLSERVTAVTFYDDEHEEWTQRTVTIADILDSVCEDYTVLQSTEPEIVRCKNCKYYGRELAHCRELGLLCLENDFCSRGEKRTDG